MKKYDIVTIGDASEDIFVRPRDLRIINDPRYVTGRGASFELGEKIILDDVEYEVGGSACNNAVAFARQGYCAAALLAIGDDTPGERISQRLIDEGVNEQYVQRRKSYKTNFSVIFNIADERTIFIYHGLQDYSCLKPPSSVSAKWVFLAPLGPESECVIDGVLSLAAEKNVNIAWNPGGFQIKKTAQNYRKLLSCTNILFVNREEAIKFANFPITPQPKDIMKVLSEYGAKIVVVTDGKRGATAYDGSNFYHCEALSQKRVDATGAGDSFATGFTGRIMQDENIDSDKIIDALRWAVVNSTSVVGQIGAQKGLLTKSQIEKTINEVKVTITML